MSSGLECDIVGLSDGRWFYILERSDTPKNAFDWRAEDPSVGGPFMSADAASKGLMRKHQNPGGYNSYKITVEEAIADPDLKRSIEKALGRELEFPPLPDEPVEIASILYGSGQRRRPDGTILRFSQNEDGTASVKSTASFSPNAEVLGTARISAKRDAASIVVTPEGDLPLDFMPMLQEIAAGRCRSVYPGELLFIKDIEEPDTSLTLGM